jgi:hypothetical protein
MEIFETTVILREIHVPEGKALKNIVTGQYFTGEIDKEKGYWIFYLGKEEIAENYTLVDEKDVPEPVVPEPEDLTK